MKRLGNWWQATTFKTPHQQMGQQENKTTSMAALLAGPKTAMEMAASQAQMVELAQAVGTPVALERPRLMKEAVLTRERARAAAT